MYCIGRCGPSPSPSTPSSPNRSISFEGGKRKEVEKKRENINEKIRKRKDQKVIKIKRNAGGEKCVNAVLRFSGGQRSSKIILFKRCDHLFS
jgi:hypothetical protein